MEAMGLINPGFWRGKRVFVTGHTGFKGSWLSIWLVSLGADVCGYALDPPTEPSLFARAGVAEIVTHIVGDVRDENALAKALREYRPDIVIHLAAQPIVRESYRHPVGTFATNIMGTVNLFESIRHCDSVHAALNVTTDKVYQNREWLWGYREDEALGGYDPYSASKACSDIITASYRDSFFNPKDYGSKHRTAVASARSGNVIGGGDWATDRLIPDCIRAFNAGQPLKIRNPNSIRPWQYVIEPLSGYLLLCERLYAGNLDAMGAWNFGPRPDDAMPVKWIIEQMMDGWKGAPGFEVEAGEHPHEANYLKLDYSKATAILGWNPRWGIRDALGKVLEWHFSTESGIPPRQVCEIQLAAYMGS